MTTEFFSPKKVTSLSDNFTIEKLAVKIIFGGIKVLFVLKWSGVKFCAVG